MLESLGRWIFDLRQQILLTLLILTAGALFLTTRITLEGVHPEAPPSDLSVRAAAEAYNLAFPPVPTLSLLVQAEGHPNLDSAPGQAWLDQLKSFLMTAYRGPAGTRGAAPDQNPVIERIAADGRAGVIELALEPDKIVTHAAFTQQLETFLAKRQPGAPFSAKVIAPSPELRLASDWSNAVVPLVAGCIILAGGLLAYSGSFAVTGLITASACLAIVWQVGCWALMGGHFYAGMRFIPALVFVLALGHGFPIARHISKAVNAGANSGEAAASVVRRLAPAGGAALIAVALALLAASLAPVPNARASLEFAALGVLFVYPAIFIVMPLLLSHVQIDRPVTGSGAEAAKQPRRIRSESLRQALAGPQTVAIVALAFFLVAALESHSRLFGPIDVSELDSGANKSWVAAANIAAATAGSSFASLAIVGRTSPEVCMRIDVLDAVDRLSWRIANIPGVTRVESVTFRLRQIQAGAHGGDLRWQDIPHVPAGVLAAMAQIPDTDALYDHQCRTLIIRAYLAPPIAGALKSVDDAVARFRTENSSPAISFELGGGPLATALSEQRMLSRYAQGMVLGVLTALAGVVFYFLKDWRAALAIAVGGLCVFVTAGWAVAVAPIGLTGHTMPLLMFVVMLSIDMTVYILAGWRPAEHAPVQFAEMPRRRSLQRDGRALVARALSMVLCFAVWMAASDEMAHDVGLLAIVTTLVGAVAAIIVIPAASVLAERALVRRALAAG